MDPAQLRAPVISDVLDLCAVPANGCRVSKLSMSDCCLNERRVVVAVDVGEEVDQ